MDTEYEMTAIEGSKNIPVDTFESDTNIENNFSPHNRNIIFVCRRGNDSQRACVAYKKFCDKKVMLK